MRVLRGRASVLASFALTWQIVALMIVPTAACCESGPAGAASDMANCPMQHSLQDAQCPMHAQAPAGHDCHCPRLGCSRTDNGFLALFGPIGVLPSSLDTPELHRTGNAAVPTAPSSTSLAPVPVAPPPRV